LRLLSRIAICQHRRCQLISDEVRAASQWVSIEMRIASRRRRLRMAEKLSDDGKPEACAGTDRRERVPEVVDTHSLKPSVPLYGAPGLLEIRPGRIGAGSRNDETTLSFAFLQKRDDDRAQHDGLASGLAVREQQEPAVSRECSQFLARTSLSRMARRRALRLGARLPEIESLSCSNVLFRRTILSEKQASKGKERGDLRRTDVRIHN
jgi:hypothetical protein